MTLTHRTTAFLSLCAFSLAAWFGAGPAPAAADSFSFSYSSGHRHRQHHHWHWHHPRHHHHHGPYVRYGYYYAPPVYYPPPPSVIYVPAPPPVVSAVPASPVYRAPNGQYCREYQSTVIVGGTPQPSYGTACQQPDGSWRVVN